MALSTPTPPRSPAPGSTHGATAAALALVVVAAGIVFVKLHYGTLWGDEGFYLATSRALLSGGAPFRDDQSHAATWFFVVLTPVLALLPEGGTLVQVRVVGLLLRLAAAGLLFLSFRRHLPPLLAGAGLAATLLANFPYLLVPSYYNLPFDASFAGVAAWIAGAGAPRRARARAWGAVAGALFALGVLCHLPRVLLLPVPLLVLLWSRRRPTAGWPGLGASAAACLITATGLVAAAFAVVAVRGWLPDLLAGWRVLAGSSAFGVGPGARLALWLGRDLPRVLAVAAAHGVFWGGALLLAARAARARAGRRLAPVAALGALVAAYAASLAYVYVHGERWFSAYYLIYPGLCWLPLCAWPPLRGTLRSLGPAASCGAALVFVTVLPQQVLVELTSTQGAGAGAAGVGASLLLLALMSVALAARLAGGGALGGLPASTPGGRFGTGVAAALCLVLAAGAAAFHFCPEENPLRAELAAFRTGRLAGLHTTPGRVAGWSELVAYLAPRVARGELLLAYSNVPLVYYVTDTRPALGATVVSSLLLTPGQRRALVERMLARGHVPRYAVRLREGTLDEAVSYSNAPAVDPVNAFVRRHYRLEARLTLFDVLRLRARGIRRRGVSSLDVGGTPAGR